MTDVKSLEHPTLKVPYEVLNKRFRIAQKHLDREVNHVTVSLSEVERSLAQEEKLERETLVQKLETLKGQLEEMKSKGGEILSSVSEVADVIKTRCDHLTGGCLEGGQDVQTKMWRRTRLDRMLVEYLLRQGYYETAMQLSDNAGVGELTNTEVRDSR